MYIPQSNPDDAPGPDLCSERELTETRKALLWKLLNDDPSPDQAAWYCIRSRKHRSRLRSRSVTSIGCGKPGSSIEGKGGRAGSLSKKKVSRRGLSSMSRLLCRLSGRARICRVVATTRGYERSHSLAAASDSHLSHAASRRRLSPVASPRADAASSLPSAVFCALVGD